MLTKKFPYKEDYFQVFYHMDCLEHQAFVDHPERPQRLAYVLKACEEINQSCSVSFQQAPAAKLRDLSLVHSKDYLRSFESCVLSGKSQFMSVDNYICDATIEAILAAVGQSFALAESLCAGRSGFALIRPPGHHAGKAKAEGFCFANNVALAAEKIREEVSGAKILIVDFDVHHGNGTDALYHEDPNTFYFSLHGNPEHIYPHSGYEDERGQGEGLGSVSNKPLPNGCSGTEWFACLQRNLSEICENFAFDYLLVSAGYDAHKDDPFSIMKVEDADYLRATEYLYKLAEQHCDGKIGFFLEGGYSLEVLSRLIPGSIELLADLTSQQA
ncbi:histone deacetylase [Lentisphaera marina]|uniref:histone deacetylase family protein n=1 Tax=Lentisphaera marina TaxID=1111041 RepID=UPI0023652FE1|nr:histone deacetylase [Lentisphaera marina]MDD7986452.1 histone deacetylase [Lentisphaera marina]